MKERFYRLRNSLSPLGLEGAAMLSAAVDVLEPAVARITGARRWVAIELDDDDFDIYRVAGNRTTAFGKALSLTDKQRAVLQSGRSDEVELRLRADHVLQTTLKIPTVGFEHLGQIIDHRLDRLTPWSQDKMFYGFASTAKAGSDGQTEVDFAATSTEIAGRSLSRLTSFGLVASRLGPAGEPVDTALRLDLFQGRRDVARSRRRQRIAIGISAVAAASVLFFAATEYLSARSSSHLLALDQALERARSALVNSSGTTSDRQADLQLIDAKTQSTAQFSLIDELARLLPDNTVLDELDLQQTSIRLAGTSGEASALIGILEAAPGLSDASFSAAVTRQADGRDRFDITAARLAPEKEVKP